MSNSLVGLTYWNSTQKVSNCEWTSKIPSPGIVINNGDTIAIKNVYLNTSNAVSGNINLRTDTPIKLQYAFYYMNMNPVDGRNFAIDNAYFTPVSGFMDANNVSDNGPLDGSGVQLFNRYRQQTMTWNSFEFLKPINWPQSNLQTVYTTDGLGNRTVGIYPYTPFWIWGINSTSLLSYPADDPNDHLDSWGTLLNFLRGSSSTQAYSDCTPYVCYYFKINGALGAPGSRYKYPDTINRIENSCDINLEPNTNAGNPNAQPLPTFDGRSRYTHVPFFNSEQNPELYKRDLNFTIKKGSYSREFIAEYITLQFQQPPIKSNYFSTNSEYNNCNWTLGINYNSRAPFTLQINLMDWSTIPVAPTGAWYNYGPLQPIIYESDENGNYLFNNYYNLSTTIPNWPDDNTYFKIPQLIPLCPITGTASPYNPTATDRISQAIMPIIQSDNNFAQAINNRLGQSLIPPSQGEGAPVIFTDDRIQNQFTYQVPLIGATQMALLYNQNNNNVFSFSMHTPILINGSPSVVYTMSNKTDYYPLSGAFPDNSNDPSFSYGTISLFDKHSGIIFTDLEPRWFWEMLGFIVDDIIIPPETYAPTPDIATDVRYRGIIDYDKFISLTSGQIVGASMITNDDQVYGSFTQRVFNDGAIISVGLKNTPPSNPIGLDKLQLYFNQTSTFWNNSFWNWTNFASYESTIIRPLTAQNSVSAPQDAPGFYMIELCGYNNDCYLEDKMMQVKTLVSTYYESLSAYTSSPFIDSYIYVHHSDTPLYLSNIKVRIINPITEQTESDVIIGPNSSVFLQITQNTKRFGLERNPQALDQQVQFQS